MRQLSAYTKEIFPLQAYNWKVRNITIALGKWTTRYIKEFTC